MTSDGVGAGVAVGVAVGVASGEWHPEGEGTTTSRGESTGGTSKK